MLENLEPKKVFQYFEEICAIPHGSGNVGAISDYLVNFAKDHGLWWTQDKLKNVIIIKEASEGKEDRPAVMIQGHMDMVTVKEPDADIDMERDPLKLEIDGDYVYAKDTSLGGDDGIALAYGLALLSDENIIHPRIELVITTEEEVGMEGATGIDLSFCNAMQMLNIDSEEEGQFVAACAGGVRVNGKIPVDRIRKKDNCGIGRSNESGKNCCKKIMLTGFTGGHSGTEIGRNGGNANVVLGWLLKELKKKADITIFELQGGVKDNAIPVEAYAVIGPGKNVGEDIGLWEEALENGCRFLEGEIKKRFLETDPACGLMIGSYEEHEALSAGLSEEAFNRLVAFLEEAPNGVQSMSKELEGLVETSLNLGIIRLENEELRVVFSLRSSVAGEKEALKDKVCNLIEKYGGRTETTGDYPAWEYRNKSFLREKMTAIYEKQYGKKPVVLSLHAGLECGILAAKKPGLDCVSFGPDILDIHTTKERMSISSVNRVWKFLVEVIETL